MTACRVTSGVSCASCNEIRTKAGVYHEVYLVNIDDLDTTVGFQGFSFTQEEDGATVVSAINLEAYSSAYKFCMKKASGGNTNELQLTDNGFKFWNTSFTGVFIPNDRTARATYDELVGGNFAIVARDFSSRFWVIGYADGVELTAATQATGVAPGDPAGFNFTFSGPVDQLPPQIDLGGFAATFNYLESLLEV